MMPDRTFTRGNPPPQADVTTELVPSASLPAVMETQRLYEELAEWRLPSGKTLREATAQECWEVGRFLRNLCFAKEDEAKAKLNSRRVANGVYEVLFDGQVIGTVKRRVGGWAALDTSGNSIRWGMGIYRTRAEAGEAVSRKILGEQT